MDVRSVLVGDRVGKTNLTIAFYQGKGLLNYEEEPVACSESEWPKTFTVDDSAVRLWLIEAFCKENGSANLRALEYQRADVVVVCYSIDSKESLVHCKTIWAQELRYHLPGVPIVLLGNKIDLRTTDPGRIEVTKEDAAAMSKEIGAVASEECSALTGDGTYALFENLVRIARRSGEARTGKGSIEEKS